MSDKATKTAAGEKAGGKNAPTQGEIKAAFDRLSTLLTCGSAYCIHNVPQDIAIGLTMAQEALGWALGHPDSTAEFDRVLDLLKQRQKAEEVLNYEVAGGPVQEQTDAIMAAMGMTRRQTKGPLAALLASIGAGPMPQIKTGDPVLDSLLASGMVVPIPMSGGEGAALAEMLLAALAGRRGGKGASKGEGDEKKPGAGGGVQ